MYQRYLRVTLYRTHPVVERDPSVGPQAAQRQSGGLSLQSVDAMTVQLSLCRTERACRTRGWAARHGGQLGRRAHVGVLDVFSVHDEQRDGERRLVFLMLGRPVVALIGVQTGYDFPGMTGAKLVLEVERHMKAPRNHLPHGVRVRWRNRPSGRPDRMWRWGQTTAGRCRGLPLPRPPASRGTT